MKKLVFVLIVLIFVLSACAKAATPTAQPTTTPYPTESVAVETSETVVPMVETELPIETPTEAPEIISMAELFAKYDDGVHLNSMTIKSVGTETMIVRFNYEDYTVKITPDDVVLQAIGNSNSNGRRMEFREVPYGEINEDYQYLLENYSTAFYDGNLILFTHGLKYMENVVNPNVWDKTNSVLTIWSHPSNRIVVQNLRTDEVAIVEDVFTFCDSCDNDRPLTRMLNNDLLWGYIHVEPGESSVDRIFLSESEPNYVLLDKMLERVLLDRPDLATFLAGKPAISCHFLREFTDYWPPKDLAAACDTYQ